LEAVLVVDFGDEFTIPFPDNFGVAPAVVDPIFVRWLRTKMKLATPALAGCAGPAWSDCHYLFRDAKAFNPLGAPQVLSGPVAVLFYYSGPFSGGRCGHSHARLSIPLVLRHIKQAGGVDNDVFTRG
jgi:hypothetical protein